MTQPTAVTELIERLQGVREGLPEAIKALEEEQDRIAGQLRTLKGLQRTLSPDSKAVPQTARSVQNAATNRKIVGPDRLLRVAEALVNRAERFSAPDVAADLKIPEPAAYAAINQLRDMEFLAKAGEAPPLRQGAKGRALYVIDPHAPSVLERLRSNHE